MSELNPTNTVIDDRRAIVDDLARAQEKNSRPPRVTNIGQVRPGDVLRILDDLNPRDSEQFLITSISDEADNNGSLDPTLEGLIEKDAAIEPGAFTEDELKRYAKLTMSDEPENNEDLVNLSRATRQRKAYEFKSEAEDNQIAHKASELGIGFVGKGRAGTMSAFLIKAAYDDKAGENAKK